MARPQSSLPLSVRMTFGNPWVRCTRGERAADHGDVQSAAGQALGRRMRPVQAACGIDYAATLMT